MHVFQAESMSVEWPGASSWNYKEIAQAVPSYKLMTMSVECSNSSKCLHHDQTANMLSLASKQAYRSQSPPYITRQL